MLPIYLQPIVGTQKIPCTAKNVSYVCLDSDHPNNIDATCGNCTPIYTAAYYMAYNNQC